MTKSLSRAVELYAIDYQKWDTNSRKKLSGGNLKYKKWFFINATRIAIAEHAYKNLFLKNPLINTAITNALLEKCCHEFADVVPSHFIYFILNPDPYLMLFKNEMFKEYKTKSISFFVDILQNIADEKIYVIVEYNKNLGWFDYDKIYEQKQKFKEQHEAEMRQIGLI